MLNIITLQKKKIFGLVMAIFACVGKQEYN